MKICYLDLNYPDFQESYAVKPKRYGGGRIAATALREIWDDEFRCDIWADKKSFIDCGEDEFSNLNHPIDWETRKGIREGQFYSLGQYDLLVHHHPDVFVNTNIPQVCWCLGLGETVNPKHTDVMLYSRKHQKAHISPNTRIYDIVIGIDIPEFKEYNKAKYIFQCSRHLDIFGSIEAARLCEAAGIQSYFAGPVEKNYPFLDYINGINSHYLGLISEESKIAFTQYAGATTYLHKWSTPFNLSAPLSLAYGTPIIATKVGFWEDFIQDGINGAFINEWSLEGFKEAYQKCLTIKQKDCYESVLKYSTQNMTASFIKVFKELY